ncbi:MAG: hypothetical protein QN157_11940 [Armatimonadota bacterium]|nr:hypothetical protein [Armatimonadota bacterium]
MTLLVWATGLTAVALVAVLAGYLLAASVALVRARRHLERLAEGLEAIAAEVQPLGDRLRAVNTVAADLLTGLRQVDEHLRGITVVLRL